MTWDSPLTIREALKEATRAFQEAGLRQPRADAEVVVAAAAGCGRAYLYTHPEELLESGQVDVFRQWLRARQRHYPLQYLRGTQEFYGREFLVTPAVLVPRPETELLVEMALDRLRRRDSRRIEVAEVGVGSGCLGLSLLCEDSRVRLTATEISLSALEVARENARRLGVARRCRLLQGDVLSPLLDPRRRFSMLVSNPPYASLRDKSAVDPGVRRFEPRQAVFAGETGLEVFERLFRHAGRILSPGGCILVEVGEGQSESVAGVAAGRGWRCCELGKDLASIERAACFKRDAAQPGLEV